MVEQTESLLADHRLGLGIPGIGPLAGDWTKVSARAPPFLNKAIASGTMPPLSQLLRSSSDAVGGFADGHAYTASGVIPRGSEPSFVGRVDELARRLGEHTEDE